MKRHAYLLMAHNNPAQLKMLLEVLDDERNDIFLHLDQRMDCVPDEFEKIAVKSKLVLLKRVMVKWGGYSQWSVMQQLLEAAHQEGEQQQRPYAYYHLLSGADFPLKSQDEIHSFFADKKQEFIAIACGSGSYQRDHVNLYYPLVNFTCYRTSRLLKGLDALLAKIQKTLGVCRNRRRNADITWCDGWTWFSITHSFVDYVLSKRDWIATTFRLTKAPDEMVLPTLAYNSEFRERIFAMDDLQQSSQRLIDWTRGRPYTWGAEPGDYELLRSSPLLFARKFDENVNLDLVKKLYEDLRK